MVKCLTCQKTIRNRRHNAIRCLNCAALRHKAIKKEWAATYNTIMREHYDRLKLQPKVFEEIRAKVMRELKSQ